MARPLLVLATLIVCLLRGPANAADLLVIANPSVGVTGSLSLSQIAAIYLLRITVWPDGRHIVPVNREATSELRTRFRNKVLKQDDASLAAYWNEMHFQGKQPPVVQESESSMLAFIRNVPGAIGYIRATTAPAGVKVLAHVP